MREIQWLKEAENELASIIGYVLDIHGQNVALQVYDNIISQIDLLLDFPELGTTKRHINTMAKFCVYFTQNMSGFSIIFKRRKSL